MTGRGLKPRQSEAEVATLHACQDSAGQLGAQHWARGVGTCSWQRKRRRSCWKFLCMSLEMSKPAWSRRLVCIPAFSPSSLSSSSSVFLFCWMTIFDFPIKKSFSLRKSNLNIELEIYCSLCDSRGRSTPAKRNWLGIFPLALKNYLFFWTR